MKFMAYPRCPRLPIELQDLILELVLPFDCEDVLSFSTVCQHWRVRTYRHTFANVLVDQSTVKSFSRIIDSPFSCSAILSAIINLHVQTKGTKGRVVTWSEPELVALYNTLAKIAKRTKLASLTLSKENVVVNCQSGLLKLFPFSFPFLTTLNLCRSTFGSRNDFTGFIALFPALKYVNLDDVRCEWPDELQSKLPRGDFVLALVVHTLSAHQTTIKWTLEDPVSAIEPGDLHSLGCLTMADIHTLLRKMGPSLRELDIDFQLKSFQGFPLEHFVNTLDLSVTPRLRHIRIGSSTRVLAFMHWVPRVLYGLAKTQNPCLDILEIRFASSRQFHLDRGFLRCLTHGLAEPQYSAIKKIHFIAYHDNPFDKDVEDTITHTIQNDLLRWHEQGLIRLTFLSREI